MTEKQYRLRRANEKEALAKTDKLPALQSAVEKALAHIVDHGKIELGTPESRALIDALKASKGNV